jgi:hypothetical protein
MARALVRNAEGNAMEIYKIRHMARDAAAARRERFNFGSY